MPKVLQGQERPAEVIGCAVDVLRLSVGLETEELRAPSGRVRSGLAGATARTESLPEGRRREIAKSAAEGPVEVEMAAMRKIVPIFVRRAQSATTSHTTKIQAFTQAVYRKTGGPTPDLRKVYDAYLANQRKTKDKI
jgi:hypothetical protein